MAEVIDPLRFLEETGETESIYKSMDWSGNPLRELADWPYELKNILSVILKNKRPKILCWGPDLICLYNEAYFRRFLTAENQYNFLGKPLATAFPGLWSKLKTPLKEHFFLKEHSIVKIKITDYSCGSKHPQGLVYSCSVAFNHKGEEAGLILKVNPPKNPHGFLGIRESARFQTQDKNLSMGIVVLHGPEFKIRTCDSSFLKIAGKEKDEVAGQPFFDIFPLPKDQHIQSFKDAFEKRQSFYGENIQVFLKNENATSGRYINLNLQPLINENGYENDLIAIITDESKEAEEKRIFEERENHLEHIIQNTGVGILVLKGENHVVEYGNNLLLNNIFNLDKINVVGKSLSEILPPGENSTFFTELKTAYQSGIIIQRKISANFFNKNQHGKEHFFNYEISPLINERSAITGLMVSVYDVSEIVRTGLKEKKMRERLEISLDAGGLALWELDLPSFKMTFSERLADIFEIGGHGISIQTFKDAIASEFHPELNNAFREALKKGAFDLECKYHRKNKPPGWLQISGKTFYDEFNNPIKIIGTTRDITEVKKKNQTLQRREQRLRHLILEAPVAIGILRGPDYKVEIINEIGAHLLGKSKDILEGKPILQIMSEVDTALAKQLLDKVYYEDKRISGAEYPVKFLREGRLEKLYVQFEYEPLKNLDGKTIGVIVMGIEVTNQVLIRKKIQKSEIRFRLLANSTPIFVCSVTADNRIDFINETFQRYSGLSLEKFRSESIFITLHPDDLERARKKWFESFKTGKKFIDEHRIKRHDGVYRWHLSQATPEMGERGIVTGWILTSTDIQEIKEQEFQKDYFITRASHELKTPITSLKGYVQILQSIPQNPNDEILNHSLKRMHFQIEKLTRLVDDLLNTTRLAKEGITVTKTKFNLFDLIQEIIEDLKFTSDHLIVFNSSSQSLPVTGDREKIGQVITNLFTNAIKYSPDEQTIWIDVTKDGRFITVTIKDNGIGIDETMHKKIFEKFYRVLNENGETYPGFGIGLYIANEILRMHNSSINVESEPGKGSAFSFRLEKAAE